VGFSTKFTGSLVNPGDDDDDQETSDNIRNYFIRQCKRDLYEAMVLNKKEEE
jgi:hypothetical protein